MSMHRSLRSASKHQRTRNVLTREEQIEKLEEDGEWSEGDSVYGLRKVRVEKIIPRKRAKEEEPEEGLEGTEGEAGAEESTEVETA